MNLCLLVGGNLRLIAALTQGVPVIYNSRVKKIAYAADGVAVQTDKHVFKGALLDMKLSEGLGHAASSTPTHMCPKLFLATVRVNLDKLHMATQAARGCIGHAFKGSVR